MTGLYFTGTCDVVVADTTVATITPTQINNEAGTVVSTLYGRLKAGDRFDCSAGHGIVASVAADGTITTTIGWYGATATGVKFNAQPMPSGSELATSVRDALAWKNTLNNLVCVRAGDAGTVAALQKMDCLIGLYFTSMTLTAPPASFDAGSAYLVGASATGKWQGRDGKIAYSRDAASWEFYAPYNGLTAYNAADGRRYRYLSGAWAGDDNLDKANTWAGQQTISGSRNNTVSPSTAFCRLLGNDVYMLSGMYAGAPDYGGWLQMASTSGAVGAYGYALQPAGGRVTVGDVAGSAGVFSVKRVGYTPQLEVDMSASNVNLLAYDRVNGSFVPFQIRGSSLLFMPSDIETARVTKTGVGIGGDPGCDLHIKKSTSPIAQIEGSNGGAGYLRIIDTSSSSGGVQLLNGSGVLKWMLGNQGLGTENFGIYTSTGSGVALRWIIDAEGLTPGVDGAQTVGNPYRRVGQIYSTNSTISISWSAKKANARRLTDAEISCAKELAEVLCLYQFEDAIIEKGADAARWHCGVIADTNQKLTAVGAVQTVCEKWGIDPLKVGFFCRDLVKKEIAKTTTHKAQKTKLVTTKPEKIITSADGTQIATYDPVEMYEPVWVTDSDGNDLWFDLTDESGNVLKDEKGNPRKYRKAAMENVLDAGTDTVYVLSDGTYSTDSTNPLVTYSYSIRYEELLCFIAAGQYQAQLKSDAALQALTETVAALSATSTATSSAT